MPYKDPDKRKAYHHAKYLEYKSKDATLLPKAAAQAHKWSKENREAKRAHYRKWSAAHREAIRAASRQKRVRSKEYVRELRRQYDLTKQNFDLMVLVRANKCDICSMDMQPPNVDHCPRSSLVRGLLCHHCNRALGHFKDRIDLLQKAIQYLRSATRELPTNPGHLALPPRLVAMYHRTRRRGPSYTRVCPCGESFEARRSDARYCNNHCRSRIEYQNRSKNQP